MQHSLMSRSMQQPNKFFYSLKTVYTSWIKQFGICLVLATGLLTASNASACIYLGAGSYTSSVTMNMVAPANGQLLTAPYGGQAAVTLTGNAKLITSIDGFDTPTCIYNTFRPRVGFVVDGNFYYSDDILPISGTVGVPVKLSPGRHTVSMRATTNFNPTGDLNNHIVTFVNDTIVTINVQEGTGPVIGQIDSIIKNSDGTSSLTGWACDRGLTQSIDVHLYAGGVAGTGTMLTSTTANLPREAAVGQACGTQGTPHGWNINLGPWQAQQTGKALYVHGISRSGGVNSMLTNSGNFSMPTLVIQTPTISLQRSPSTMIAGQNYTITWNTANATALSYNCTTAGSGFSGSGTLPVNGSNSDIANAAWVNNPSNCTWTATGPGGTKTIIETLTTVAAPTISVSRTPMSAGKNYTVAWATTGATSVSYSCTAGGTGFSGTGNLPTLNGTSNGVASAGWVGYPSSCRWTASGPGGSTTTNEILTTSP